MIVRRFELRRRYVADRFQQPTVIEPVDPFQGCVFHGLQMSSRAAAMNDLRLVQPDDRFGQRVVVRIADTAYTDNACGTCIRREVERIRPDEQLRTFPYARMSIAYPKRGMTNCHCPIS